MTTLDPDRDDDLAAELDDHRRLRAELQAAIAAEQGQP